MTNENPTASMNKDEQIGFHKGALSVLSEERKEMAKILNIVEQLMQMHLKGLKDLGVDLVAQAEANVPASNETKNSENLDELL